MSKTLIFLFISILLTGCIVIEENIEENDTSREDLNLTFDLEAEETEEPETVGEVLNRPDMEITTIYWSTLFPDTNESVDLGVKVANKGNTSVDGFNYKITLFKDNDKWKEQNYEHEGVLERDDTTKITKTFSFDKPGQFKAEAYIDWDNSIKELDELNNYKQTSPLTVSESTEEESEEESEEINVTLGGNKCVDSDDGINYHEKGRCVDDGPFILGMNDYCETKFSLVELYCTNTTQRCRFAEAYRCYCKNGACV
ncbi:hypothetical protein KY360_05780 [Candidatus Woesearchaeota archaeon]|nr:hypothetical protein [Candidatus Woesearchaeota archaeon]